MNPVSGIGQQPTDPDRAGGRRPSGRGFVPFFAGLLVTLVLVDLVVFRHLLWQVPNESAWQTDPFYSYLHDSYHIPPGSPAEFRIIVTGSSLVPYGLHARQLEGMLREKTGRNVRVFFVSHRGKNTLNLLAQKKRLLSFRPDMIVVPVNMVDFRLERLAVIAGWQRGSHTSGQRNEALEKDLLELYDYGPLAPEFMMNAFLKRGAYVRALDNALRYLFAFYRYHEVILTGPRLWWKHRFRSGKSYHHYQGIPVGGGGIDHRGWTAPSFELYGNVRRLPERLPVEYTASDEGALWISPGLCAEKQWVHTEPRKLVLRSGWQNITLDRTLRDRTICLRVEPSGYRHGIAGPVGVRLSEHYGLPAEELASAGGPDSPGRPGRERPFRREDSLYLSYSDSQYRRSFQERVLARRAGMQYLEALMNTKNELARKPFDPELPPFQYLKRFASGVEKEGVELVVYNSPENPLSLSAYGQSEWYAGYLRTLSRLSLSEDYSFYDYKSMLPMQYFYDYHHLSYYGAVRLTEALAEDLSQKMAKGD